MRKIRAAILTLSDKASRNERVDETGPLLRAELENLGYEITEYLISSDDYDSIVNILKRWADSDIADLILTNGGTGFSPRDITPEATLEVIERRTPGISEAMRLASLSITPKAMLSRAESGIRKNTLIINLPGSPKGAFENWQAISAAIPHGIAILRKEAEECAEAFVPKKDR